MGVGCPLAGQERVRSPSSKPVMEEFENCIVGRTEKERTDDKSNFFCCQKSSFQTVTVCVHVNYVKKNNCKIATHNTALPVFFSNHR